MKRVHTNSSADMQQSDLRLCDSRLEPKKTFPENKWSGYYWKFCSMANRLQLRNWVWTFLKSYWTQKWYLLIIFCLFLICSELHRVYQICSTTLWTLTAGADYGRSSAWQSQSGFLLGKDILLFSKSDTDRPHHRDIFRQRLPDKLITSSTIIISSSFPRFCDTLEKRKLLREYN